MTEGILSEVHINELKEIENQFGYELADKTSELFEDYWDKARSYLPNNTVGRFINAVIGDFVWDNAKPDKENIDWYFGDNPFEFVKDLREKIGIQVVANAFTQCYLIYLPDYYEIFCTDQNDNTDVNDISAEYYGDLGYQIVEKPNYEFWNDLNDQQEKELNDLLKPLGENGVDFDI